MAPESDRSRGRFRHAQEQSGRASAPPSREVDAFLAKAARIPALSQVKGRLIFAIDATMSRQPTWDRAAEIQTGDVRRRRRRWADSAFNSFIFAASANSKQVNGQHRRRLCARAMQRVTCCSGVRRNCTACWLMRSPRRGVQRSAHSSMSAIAFEENADAVAKEAAQLALLGVPAFMFHEGHDASAEAVFREIARLTHGVYARFDAGSARQLRELLTAAAVYATGGSLALKDYGNRVGGEVLRLSQRNGQEIDGAHSPWLQFAYPYPRAPARVCVRGS